MASQLIINGQNIGADATVSIQDSLGRSYPATQLGLLLDVDATFEDTVIKTKTIVGGGLTFNEVIPGGISMKLNFARFNGNITGMIADFRTNFFNGNRITYTVQVQVRNPDQSVDNFLFNNGKLSSGNFGGFKPDGAVMQSIGFEFQDITTTSAGGSNSLFTATSTVP